MEREDGMRLVLFTLLCSGCALSPLRLRYDQLMEENARCQRDTLCDA